MSDEQQKPTEQSIGSDKPEKPARPAKAAAPKPEAPPDPRAIEAQQVLDTIRKIVESKFGAEVFEETLVAKFRPTFVIKPQYWVDVMAFLKQDPSLAFDYVECMVGTDYPAKGYIEVAVYVQSLSKNHFINAKVRADRDNPVIPSLTSLFRGVNWEEREIFDLLGVTFEGHPDLRRIMMPDDWKGHPLRKDYSVMD
jgi:NADH-quinone oxidoreductase subunit C